MKVLVACEDHTNDRFIVKPIVEQAVRDWHATPRVAVVSDPRLRGIDELLAMIPTIASMYPASMFSRIIVVADHDGGHKNNRDRLADAVRCDARLIPCCAVEEIETWMLALYRSEFGPWKQVREDVNAKALAASFLQERFRGPGHGRKAAMRVLDRTSWTTLKQLCPELAELSAALTPA